MCVSFNKADASVHAAASSNISYIQTNKHAYIYKALYLICYPYMFHFYPTKTYYRKQSLLFKMRIVPQAGWDEWPHCPLFQPYIQRQLERPIEPLLRSVRGFSDVDLQLCGPVLLLPRQRV